MIKFLIIINKAVLHNYSTGNKNNLSVYKNEHLFTNSSNKKDNNN